jgi:hypothetical protein
MNCPAQCGPVQGRGLMVSLLYVTAVVEIWPLGRLSAMRLEQGF